MTMLPIFATQAGREADVDVEGLVHETLGVGDYRISRDGAQSRVEGPGVHGDIDRAAGGIWLGATERLWKSDQVEAPRPEAIREIALETFARHRLTAAVGRGFRLTEGRVMTGSVVTEDENGRTERPTEATFSQDVVVDVADAGLSQKTLPVFGGGGRFRVVVGAGGLVSAVHGTWRDTTAVTSTELLSLDDALERAGLKRETEQTRVTDATLGYYSAPSFVGQELMFPVYAVSADVTDGTTTLPSRIRLIPATEIGEIGSPERPTPDRSRIEGLFRPRDLPKLRPGVALPAGVKLDPLKLKDAGINPRDVLVKLPGGVTVISPKYFPDIFELLRPRSFGTSWIGSAGGLNGSQANAQGFVDQMNAEGWQRRFNWGNWTALKSDWVKNDDQYVDDVDFVFYTGHANADGWMLVEGGNLKMLNHTEVGTLPNSPSDHWGQNNLEWMIIAACGPLQDDSVNGGGNVFDRWRGAFDGLHLLMGYAAVTYDNTEEGRRVAMYARQGMTLKDAWFRTAQEIQPSTNTYKDPNGPDIYAACISTGNQDGSTANDHIWGRGSVGPDVRTGSRYRQYWTSPC